MSNMMRKVRLTDTERDTATAWCQENGCGDPTSIAAYLDTQLMLKKDRIALSRSKQPTGRADGRVTADAFRNAFHSLAARHGTKRAKEITGSLIHKSEHAIRTMMQKWDFDTLEIQPEYSRAFFKEVTGMEPGPRT